MNAWPGRPERVVMAWLLCPARKCVRCRPLDEGVTALAKQLRGASITVNAADVGYTATDSNHHSGTRTVEEAARAAVRLAVLCPEGQFFDEEGTVPW